MHCPFCQHDDTRVIDSRLTEDGSSVRRRRECPACGERFNTFETAEIKLPVLVKSDARREAFDEAKLRTGFERALQKRPVSPEQVDTAVRAVLHAARMTGERELPSRRVGEFVMAELKKLDQVGYVRFASVYRRFEDVQAFREEVERLERDLPSLGEVQLPLLDSVAGPGSAASRAGSPAGAPVQSGAGQSGAGQGSARAEAGRRSPDKDRADKGRADHHRADHHRADSDRAGKDKVPR